jgi:hypothetical protein
MTRTSKKWRRISAICPKIFSPLNTRRKRWIPQELTISKEGKTVSQWWVYNQVAILLICTTRWSSTVRTERCILLLMKGIELQSSSSTGKRFTYADSTVQSVKKYTQNFGLLSCTYWTATSQASCTYRSKHKKVSTTTYPTSLCPDNKTSSHCV